MGNNTSLNNSQNKTPKIAKMPLKIKKRMLYEGKSYGKFSDAKNRLVLIDLNHTISTKNSPNIRPEFHPKSMKAELKKLEQAQVDLPCDPENESCNGSILEIIAPNTDPQIIPTPFTFSENFPIAVSKNVDNEEEMGGNLKIDNQEDYSKTLEAQARLIKEILNTPTCDYCKNPLIPKEDHFTKACGHTFHCSCVESTLECPECYIENA